MKLSINKEQAKSSIPLFGADFKVTARLDASPEEVDDINRRSLGGFEMARLPNSMGSRFALSPLYVGEILNQDWEYKCKTMEDAQTVETMVIQACKDLKYRLEQPDTSGPKVIDL